MGQAGALSHLLDWAWISHILRIYMSSKTQFPRLPTLALRQRKARLLRSLKLPHHLIHASLLERFLTCGRPNCSCHQGQKHGPFFYLNRCLPKGRMSSLLLKSDAQVIQARQAVQAYRQLLETLDQLSWINLELLRRGEPLAGEPVPA
jgi:hypothetical protein